MVIITTDYASKFDFSLVRTDGAFGLKAKSQEYSLKFDEGFVAGCCDSHMILSTFFEMDKVGLKKNLI